MQYVRMRLRWETARLPHVARRSRPRSLEALLRLALGALVVGSRLVHRDLDVAQDVGEIVGRTGPLALALGVRLLGGAVPGGDQRTGVTLELAQLRVQLVERLVDVGAGLPQCAEVDEKHTVVHRISSLALKAAA